jgi:hypothetical protein
MIPPGLDPSDCNPGASASALAALETALGQPLPADFVAFLRLTDGYSGPAGEHYLAVWGTGELAELATGYDVLPVRPGQFLFGSNGGPTAFGFQDKRFISVPFGSADPDDIRILGDSWEGFIAAIVAGEGW